MNGREVILCRTLKLFRYAYSVLTLNLSLCIGISPVCYDISEPVCCASPDGDDISSPLHQGA